MENMIKANTANNTPAITIANKQILSIITTAITDATTGIKGTSAINNQGIAHSAVKLPNAKIVATITRK